MDPSKQLTAFTPEQVDELLQAALTQLEETTFAEPFKSGLLSGIDEARTYIADAAAKLPPQPDTAKAIADYLVELAGTYAPHGTTQALALHHAARMVRSGAWKLS